MKTRLAQLILVLLFTSGIVQAQDMAKVAPDNIKVTLDNEKVRVMEMLLKPGDKIPMHSHPAHIVCPITPGIIKSILPDGKVREIELKPGQSMWGEPMVHANEAVTDVHLMFIELKEPVKKEQKETKKQ